LGFGALDDAKLVRQFADVARREYLAVGFRVALHPQVDLATEPRWPRISGTFGEDAHVAARLVQAYIAGFQGGALGPESVACMTKHFPGGGPQNEGLDPHFKFHKGQVYPGGNFDYHLIPFEAAIRAGTAAMMPYYGVPVGQTDEEVAMSFNKAIISGLLRGKYGFEGVVCTDWGLITDHRIGQVVWEPRAWGVEHLSEAERVGKALEAGVDMFGGESCPQHVVELVRSGRLDERRVDESARRVLRLKFQLGLFDQPFVDEGRVDEVMGDPMSMQMGAASQRRAMVMLSNRARRPSAGKQAEKTLPLEGKPRIYVEGMQTETAAQYGEVVGAPEEAEFAIVRVDTPWVAVETDNPFARNFHHGDLDFKGEAKAHLLDLMRRAPTIVVIYLDRPAVIPEIAEQAAALVGEFGASDEAVLDVLFGRAQAEGRLPFELPGSMEAVRRQKADVPHDSEEAMFPFGFREE
jgi:beta-glucosidase